MWEADIENNSEVKAVVFSSAKPYMFIAGADIFDIKRVEDKNDLVGLIQEGMDFFNHMRAKKVPLVCAINGPALGGGLEWAMWCDYRVCSNSSKTKLGLPEVKLGLLPGFGGTQNLHETVGLQNAMDMMLTGKDIRPDKAKKMGLVDLVVAPQSVDNVDGTFDSVFFDGLRSNHQINESHFLGLVGADVFPRQHHVHCVLKADKLVEILSSAKSGKQSELDFW
jgi:enoyl-CoA hydratase/long-chain 3-hydroxyacyl-CoA dehydrogenase